MKNFFLPFYCLFIFNFISLTLSADKPNVIYVLADDLGYGDLSCLNSDSKIKTPFLDNMAKEGMIFNDAHSSSAVCTPTRYGIITGRYSWRSPLKQGVLQGYSPALIKPNLDTVAKLLKRNGYNTACIGKWHLGLDWATHEGQEIKGYARDDQAESKVDMSQPFRNGPIDCGFDYFYGISASLDFPPYVFLEQDRATVVPTATRKARGKRVGGPAWESMRAGLAVVGFEPEHLLPKLASEVRTYINKQEAEKPFFIYLPITAPHTPVNHNSEFLGTSQAGIYGDFVREIDAFMGDLIKTLKAKKLHKNTLVIFTADNGCSRVSFSPEFEEKYQHKTSYIYKGRKGGLDEGGHRVPFIASWPNKIKANSRSNQLSCLNDLYATMSDILKEKAPHDAGVDSFSLLDAFEGKPSTARKVIHHDYGGGFAIRSGKWKLNLGKTPGKEKLYDLENDPSETTSVNHEFPEVMDRLKKEITNIISKGRSINGPKLVNDAPEYWPQLHWMKKL